MATFYYYPNACLHLCNQLLSCTEESFTKLKEKGKVGEERLGLLHLLQEHKLLTLPMISRLCDKPEDFLHEELDALMEYGLVIKQFFNASEYQESIKTQTFYSASDPLPKEAVLPAKKNDFTWSKELSIVDAMSILSFNQFHLSLLHVVPKKAIQAQRDYTARKVTVDGRYKLKSKRFRLGYSHMMVLSVRDFAAKKIELVDRLLQIRDAFAFGKEKMPWFVLLCENKEQCCQINSQIKGNPSTKELSVYFLLDTDFEYGENPLSMLQTYRFTIEDKNIVSETFRIDKWYS